MGAEYFRARIWTLLMTLRYFRSDCLTRRKKRVGASLRHCTRRDRRLGAKNLKSSIEKVLRDALGDLPKEALLLARIEKAILAARQQPVVRMHVHPSVFSLVDSVVRQFNEQYGQTGCEVVADLRQHESECRIETEKGVFEVDYDRQIKALCDDLLRELRIGRERQRVSAS
jgi:flagellar biosynthesis/type III secretory pathway protein FliH